ncbi:hypothetical protein C8Q74DRAFT_1214246 [Fomes fomentarius]|nr:hypothetical protein C8Q74DRAFT_1214246 [Fomes fomentarius]
MSLPQPDGHEEINNHGSLSDMCVSVPHPLVLNLWTTTLEEGHGNCGQDPLSAMMSIKPAMDNSRLPIEICEHIIDSSDLYPKTTTQWTRAPCATMAVRSSQVNSLFRTLEENSHLAHQVVELQVGHYTGKYIPFPRLVGLLKNCIILDLQNIDQWMDYPPRFADTCLSQFSLLGIVKLSVTVSTSTARALLRFIRSLTKLETLILSAADALVDMRQIPAPSTRHSLHNGASTAFSKLKKLVVKYYGVSIKLSPQYFGDTVEDLSLYCSDRGISHKEDDTYDPQSMGTLRTLFSILRSRSYLAGRSGLLDILVGADMFEVLDGFPSLSQLRFALYENDKNYDEVWWKEKMVRRLPSRLHTVTIEVYLQFDNYLHLWLTEDEIVARKINLKIRLGGPRTGEDDIVTNHHRRKLNAGEWNAYRVDFDLESEDIATNDLAFNPSTLLPRHHFQGVRRKLNAIGWNAHRVDFVDLESENLGEL